jgi:ATP-dependent DNA helicase DinG
LKQGAGRLIRTETDRGLLVLCDPRLRQMRYGRRLLAALPPMGVLHDEGQAMQWLAQLSSGRGPGTALHQGAQHEPHVTGAF